MSEPVIGTVEVSRIGALGDGWTHLVTAMVKGRLHYQTRHKGTSSAQVEVMVWEARGWPVSGKEHLVYANDYKVMGTFKE